MMVLPFGASITGSGGGGDNSFFLITGQPAKTKVDNKIVNIVNTLDNLDIYTSLLFRLNLSSFHNFTEFTNTFNYWTTINPVANLYGLQFPISCLN